jgi:hypothetical protein
MTRQTVNRFKGTGIVPVDPIHCQTSCECEYDPADMMELDELCKRSCTTPRAYLTPAQKAAILAQPPDWSNSLRSLIAKHDRLNESSDRK